MSSAVSAVAAIRGSDVQLGLEEAADLAHERAAGVPLQRGGYQGVLVATVSRMGMEGSPAAPGA